MTRYLLYSHDTYGLGHFRRSSVLARALVVADPEANVLIVTGSPQAQAFPLPDRVDTVKLPCATKDARGSYRPRRLGRDLAPLVRLRGGLILAAASAFEPDVIVIDHAPLGMGGELEPLLDHLAERSRSAGASPRLVLGLRDIIDEAGRVDAAWHRDGVWRRLHHYDHILVYGDESVPTTAAELDLALRVDAGVTHTGYLTPHMPEPLGGEPFLLVTPGGGGDGHHLLRRYLDAVAAGVTGDLRSVVVTGPLLSAGRRAELLTRADQLRSVHVIEFSDRLRSLISSATGVVSMAGYNTVVEELATGRPALLVPRCSPRLEQYLRATRLAARTPLEAALVEHLDPGRLAAFVDGCTADRRPRTSPGVAVGGVTVAVRTLMALAGHSPPFGDSPVGPSPIETPSATCTGGLTDAS